MSKVCNLCGKGGNSAVRRYAGVRATKFNPTTKRWQKPNTQKTSFGSMTLRVCSTCRRTISKPPTARDARRIQAKFDATETFTRES